MPGVKCLQHIECLCPAALPNNDPVGAHTKRCADQVMYGDRRNAFRVGIARLQANQIIHTLYLKLCGIFDCNNAFIGGNILR